MPIERNTQTIDRGLVSYQLRRDEVDVPTMVDDAQNMQVRLRRGAVAAALVSPGWSDSYPSLMSFPLRLRYREYSRTNGELVNVFDPKLGGVNVPAETVNSSPLGEFFTPLRAIQRGNFTQLRGLTYYTALDFRKDTPEKKLEIMREDIEEGLSMLESNDRRELGLTEYLLYLGILDHLKTHTLTAFHALTFHERKGEIPADIGYLEARQTAQELMSVVTRAFYQTCIGQPFDAKFDPPQVRDTFSKVAEYILHSGHSSIEHFTFPEVSHPITIMLGAHEAALKKPYPDMIIGIPSGGTEVALVTHLMYQILYPEQRVPDMRFTPLSFHYRHQGGIEKDRLVEILRVNGVGGKSILVVDDNANTGATIQRMSDAAYEAGANSISAHIAEIDPCRVIAKHHGVYRVTPPVVNMYHPDLKTAMGISWISDQGGDDLRRREVEKIVLKDYRDEKRSHKAFSAKRLRKLERKAKIQGNTGSL